MSIWGCPKKVKTIHDEMRDPHNIRLPHVCATFMMLAGIVARHRDTCPTRYVSETRVGPIADSLCCVGPFRQGLQNSAFPLKPSCNPGQLPLHMLFIPDPGQYIYDNSPTLIIGQGYYHCCTWISVDLTDY